MTFTTVKVGAQEIKDKTPNDRCLFSVCYPKKERLNLKHIVYFSASLTKKNRIILLNS